MDHQPGLAAERRRRAVEACERRAAPRHRRRRRRGRLWLVEADGPDEVAALCMADPFWPTGLRKAVRVLAWMQVFADGKRRI
jgi:hypothetical protein